MEITGERLIPAPRAAVWQALNDSAVLQAAIPGCTSLMKDDDTHLTATATVKVGPISAKFAGKVQLLDLDPPHGYRITGEGQGGIAGFAKGGATIRLSDRDGGTLLEYSAEAQIGGKIAQLGARLIDSTAKQMTGLFFDRFVAAITAVGAPCLPAVADVISAPSRGSGLAAPLSSAQAPDVTAVPTPTQQYANTITLTGAMSTIAHELVGRWHGASILLGVVTGAAIALIAMVVGHSL